MLNPNRINENQSDRDFRKWYKFKMKSSLCEISDWRIKDDIAEHISSEYAESIDINDKVLMHKDPRAIARDIVFALNEESFVEVN